MYNNVGKTAIIIRMAAPKYLPKTISNADTGLVSNNSMVPCFFSSAKLRMVTAGTKSNKTHGANWKNGVKSLYLLCKMLYSPSKIQRNNPHKIKNSPMTKYPVSETKKDLISLNNMAFIYFIFYSNVTNLSTLHACGLSLKSVLVYPQTSLNKSEWR